MICYRQKLVLGDLVPGNRGHGAPIAAWQKLGGNLVPRAQIAAWQNNNGNTKATTQDSQTVKT